MWCSSAWYPIAVREDTTGSGNIGVGRDALGQNRNGSYNTAVGYEGLYDNLTGDKNVAMGYGALYHNENTSHNVAVGDSALYQNDSGIATGQDGTGLVAIGSRALSANTTGYSCTAVGYHALQLSSSADNNTAIGFESLSSDGSGYDNTAVGTQSLMDNTGGHFNTAIGFWSMQFNTNGYDNVAAGDHALQDNNSGYSNAACGTAALQLNTSGIENTAIGAFALQTNITGNNNTAVGHDADVASNNLTNATALGANATVSQSNSLVLGNNADVGIGTSSPSHELSIYDIGGNGNAEIGLQTSSKEMVLGLNNSYGVIGTVSNTNMTLRTNNATRMTITNAGDLGIGTTSPFNKVDIEGNVAIGSVYSGLYYAPTDGAIIQGSVGIGTASPGRKVEVSGSGYQAARITSTNGSQAAVELKRTGGGNDWRMMDSGGILYFGQSSDDLGTVNEVVRMGGGSLNPASDNIITLGSSSQRWTAVWAVNGTIQTSDERDKTSIAHLDSGLSEVMRLNPVSYRWKDPHIDNQRQHLGFVAQELRAVVPEAVVSSERHDDEDDGGSTWEQTQRLGVNYAELIPVLTKAIQEQQAQIEVLEKEVDSSKGEQIEISKIQERLEKDDELIEALRTQISDSVSQ